MQEVRFKIVDRLWIVFFVTASTGFASADNDAAMNFQTIGPNIYATGVIGPETPAAFEKFVEGHSAEGNATVYLHSSGGDASAGIKLGRLIRKFKLNTNVGLSRPDPNLGQLSLNADNKQRVRMKYHPNPFVDQKAGFWDEYPRRYTDRDDIAPFPGTCESACALAFVGGVERTLIANSRYGVHQFYAPCRLSSGLNSMGSRLPVNGLADCPGFNESVAQSQSFAAEIAGYFEDMGVRSQMLAEMAKTKPQNISELSRQDLLNAGVLFAPEKESWDLSLVEDGRLTYRGTFTTATSHYDLSFICLADSPHRVGMGVAYFVPVEDRRAFEIASHAQKRSWQPVEFVYGDNLYGKRFSLPVRPGFPRWEPTTQMLEFEFENDDPQLVSISKAYPSSPLYYMRTSKDRATFSAVVQSSEFNLHFEGRLPSAANIAKIDRNCEGH